LILSRFPTAYSFMNPPLLLFGKLSFQNCPWTTMGMYCLSLWWLWNPMTATLYLWYTYVNTAISIHSKQWCRPL